ncbi:FAS1 domain-containing protein [Yarrowia sp. C11]|nr:FAS1 domain-containing protein [Yarrowia sp. E02]KAG5373015.1 FAS1 domain-containing protein [Yarrowia sp. C11]
MFGMLPFLSLLLLSLTLVVAQIPPESRTIIDVLSQTGQFSVLLRHLQRHELIPYINTQRNITLVAPDNGAFAQFEGHVTRELLLYHILSGSATFENSSDGSHVFLSALDHVPVDVEISHKQDSMSVNGVDVVETDLEAGRQRGYVQVLESVLALPSTWQKEIGKIPRLSHFAKLANEAKLGDLSNMTLLAPSNDAMWVFTPLMDSYLMCRDGSKDLERVLNHFIIDELVYGSRDGVYGGKQEYTSRDGTVYSFSEMLTVNKTWDPLATNIPCQNGLIHVYDNLMTDEPLLTFTPRMALQGLGLDRFVALLRLAGLEELIEGKGSDQTIFAPVEKPSAMEVGSEPRDWSREVGGSEPRDWSRELEHHLSSSLSQAEQQRLVASLESELSSSSSGLYSEGGAYHFTQSELILSHELLKHRSHLLVDTKMKSKKIGYRSQRLKLAYDEVADEFAINDRRIVSSPKYGTNLFVVGNSSIYLIDEEMEPPSGLASSVAPIFHTSRSLFYLNELGRLKLPLNYAGWTLILPTTTAWDDLGITTEYLSTNKTALTLLFDSLIFHNPFYSDSKPVELPTFDLASNVSISWVHEKGEHKKDDVNFISVGGDLYKVNTLEYDILFNSGVVHTVENVFIPSALDVTVSNLIETTNSDFMQLLQASNLSYTLDPALGYSFLVPTEDSMVAENISIHSPDLGDYMKLHVIQNNTLSAGGSASTLKNGVSLVAKKFSEKLLMVSIFQGIDREARILNRGIASNNATVFAIDRPLSPSWIIPDNPWFPSHDHLRTPVAIFIGIIIGLIAFFAILSCLLWVFLGKSREPDEERAANPAVVTKPKPKSRTDVLRQEAGASTPLLAGGSGKNYATAPMSVNQPKKNGRGLKIGPQH